MSSSSSESSPSLARRRWGLLQQAILNKTIPEPYENPASKRVFQRYSDLVEWTYEISKSVMHVHVYIPFAETAVSLYQKYKAEANNDKKKEKITMSASTYLDGRTTVYSIHIHRSKVIVPVNIKNFQGYDQTGRICIWPSEQILTYWSLQNPSKFEGKKVIEIGGGFHCLAGLALAKYSKVVKQVILTDGDQENIDEVRMSIQRNCISSQLCHATTLRWGTRGMKSELKSAFDLVIAADVVYDSSFFTDLLETIALLLKPGGELILFNPKRDGMLQQFLKMAQGNTNFSEVTLTPFYDVVVDQVTKDLIKTHHAYNKEWHYPIRVHFKRAGTLPEGANNADN